MLFTIVGFLYSILYSILSKPDQSPYDTLIIDAGETEDIKTGSLVFALGDIPIGRIQEVYEQSSKAVLFSSPKEKTEVVISGTDIFMQISGRGGGNFEMVVSRDLELLRGTAVLLRGIEPYLVANVVAISTDPRDALKRAILTSPVNIQELKFVQVEK